MERHVARDPCLTLPVGLNTPKGKLFPILGHPFRQSDLEVNLEPCLMGASRSGCAGPILYLLLLHLSRFSVCESCRSDAALVLADGSALLVSGSRVQSTEARLYRNPSF